LPGGGVLNPPALSSVMPLVIGRCKAVLDMIDDALDYGLTLIQ